jgi:acyl-CoA thioesterase I
MYKIFSCRQKPLWTYLSIVLIALQASAATIKIQPLGDSITYGPGLVPCVSYRYPLFKLLVAAGIDFQYVGALIDGATYQPVNGKSMSPNHEGRWGYRIDQINSELPGYLNGYSPDWSLIYLGTNNGRDGISANQVYSQMSSTIDLLRTKNPRMVIFLALLANNQGLLAEYNTQYTNLARAKTTTNSPVIIINPPAGWNASAHTYDGTHPNAAGADLMANNFFQSIQTYLGTTRINAVQTMRHESASKIMVTRNDHAYSVKLPVQNADVELVSIDGRLLSSVKAVHGLVTISMKTTGDHICFLRVIAPGYNASIPLR